MNVMALVPLGLHRRRRQIDSCACNNRVLRAFQPLVLDLPPDGLTSAAALLMFGSSDSPFTRCSVNVFFFAVHATLHSFSS